VFCKLLPCPGANSEWRKSASKVSIANLGWPCAVNQPCLLLINCFKESSSRNHQGAINFRNRYYSSTHADLGMPRLVRGQRCFGSYYTQLRHSETMRRLFNVVPGLRRWWSWHSSSHLLLKNNSCVWLRDIIKKLTKTTGSPCNGCRTLSVALPVLITLFYCNKMFSKQMVLLACHIAFLTEIFVSWETRSTVFVRFCKLKN